MLRLTKLPAIFFLAFALLFSFSSLATVQTANAESHVPIPTPPTTPPGGGGPAPTPSPTPTPGGPSGGSDYELLAPIPGTDGELLKNPDLVTYLNSMYRIVIGLAGVLAVLMIVIGGIEYIFSALPSAKSDAKNRITGAVLGLILILIAWIILNTINPYLLDIGIDLEEVGGGSYGDLPPPAPSPRYCFNVVGADGNPRCSDSLEECRAEFADKCDGGGAKCTLCLPEVPVPDTSGPCGIACSAEEHNKVLERLKAGNVAINARACTAEDHAKGPAGVGCTSLGGLPNNAISSVIQMQKLINPGCTLDGTNDCGVVITGGTEFWTHATHGPGKAVVDLRVTPEVNQHLTGNAAVPAIGNTNYFSPSGASCQVHGKIAHWHCTF